MSSNRIHQNIINDLNSFFKNVINGLDHPEHQHRLMEMLLHQDAQDHLLDIITNPMLDFKPPKAKKLKDPNAPKRPMSAYLFFCNYHRADVREDNPGLKFKDVQRHLSVMWKAADANERAPFIEQAAKAKEDYAEAMKAYVRPDDEELVALKCNNKKRRAPRGSKKKKNPNAPKRARSAYIFFCQALRPKIAAEYEHKDVMRKLGELWREEYKGTEAGQKYRDMALADKERYLGEQVQEEVKPMKGSVFHAMAGDMSSDDTEEPAPMPKKKRGRPKMPKLKLEPLPNFDSDSDVPKPKSKPKSKPKPLPDSDKPKPADSDSDFESVLNPESVALRSKKSFVFKKQPYSDNNSDDEWDSD